jgi:hypothetical protein
VRLALANLAPTAGSRGRPWSSVGELERRWIAARKAARWLGVPPPPLDGNSVDGFVARHGGDYVALRAALAERLGTA